MRDAGFLSFASVLPPKYCPVDKEEMKGNWEFCPIHGAKLDQPGM